MLDSRGFIDDSPTGAQQGRLARRLLSYLEKRRLPYVLERDEGAIVLQFSGLGGAPRKIARVKFFRGGVPDSFAPG